MPRGIISEGTMRLGGLLAAGLLSLLLSKPGTAAAQDTGRLLATSGVTQLEGAGGGGLVPWALITGYGTRDAVGANVHYTGAYLSDFTLHSPGASVGLYNRVELSYAHEFFLTGATGAKLGLGSGYRFDLDVVGVKVRVTGDAVYDQDSWLPQIAVGTQFKTANSHNILRALGARSPSGVDFYVAATKLFMAESLLVNATLRETEANQFGLLGFGGDRGRGYSTEFEGSAAFLLQRNLAIGAEVRTKPDNLGFAREDTAFDIFGVWFINKHISTTVAFLDLGRIANQGNQIGGYLSLQFGF